MSKQSSLGQFEQVVLTAVLGLGDAAYGVTIHRRCEELMQPKGCQLGPVYVTLDRLEEKGLLQSLLSEPTAQRGGRKKRYYRLSPRGEEALGDAASISRRLYQAVEEQWGDQRWSQA
jgi:DNA-binding PadR family transcriptional regulator